METKLCCRFYPVLLIFISLILATAIWYFDEGVKTFEFLINKKELPGFVGSTLFISVIPIGIFYWLNDKDRYQSKAKVLALLGFLPALAVLFFTLF